MSWAEFWECTAIGAAIGAVIAIFIWQVSQRVTIRDCMDDLDDQIGR